MLDITVFPEPFNWLYTVAADRIQNALADALENTPAGKESLKLSVQYIEGKALNASVWHNAASGCQVNISSSVPVLVYMACIRYAHTLDPLTGLPYAKGGRGIVRKKKLAITHTLSAPLRSGEEAEQIIEEFHRKKYRNSSLGLFLYEMAMKYLAMHECMHVIMGHTRYLEENFSFRSFMEFSAERDAALNGAFSKMLELIADRHAIRGLLGRLLAGDFDEFYRENVLNIARCGDALFIVRCLVNAFCLLFHLFPGNDNPLDDPDASHPHPYVRARWLSNELMQDSDGLFPDIYAPVFAMTAAASHLSANFTLPANWQQAMENDFNPQTGKSFADTSYSNILAMAKKWQTALLKNYGPGYGQ